MKNNIVNFTSVKFTVKNQKYLQVLHKWLNFNFLKSNVFYEVQYSPIVSSRQDTSIAKCFGQK